MIKDAYIVAAVRTAGGRRGGRLRDWHPGDLGGVILDALIERSGIDPGTVDDVIMGCVSQVGQQAGSVGRTAVLSSSLPDTVPATTIDRQCGSSQQSVHFAAQAILSGSMDVVIAAGVESMSRVPIGLARTLPAEHGFGQPKSPRMEARYPAIVFSQFDGAEAIARKHGFSRRELDAFALRSHENAARATESGLFVDEIVPVVTTDANGHVSTHNRDEGIRYDTTLGAIGNVKTVSPGGRISAANASQICDGAAGLLLVSGESMRRFNLLPLARVHQMTVMGGDPIIMLETPIAATRRALGRAGMQLANIDLYEVNEAFASVPLAWLKELGADPARLNVNGGAIALGHPLGASGAKLMTTLVHALRAQKKRWGLQAMCEGGGLANVTIIEAL